jgi:hypothetical protein
VSEIISKAYATWMDGKDIKDYLSQMTPEEKEYLHDLMRESKLFRFTIDEYTDGCIEKITKELGFNNRKEAVRFAVQKVVGMIEQGKLK